MEPELLSLQDRIDHDTLEAAVDAVNSRRFPGWRIVYDRIKVEMVTGSGQQPGWRDFAGAAQVFTQTSARSPERVWVIILEDTSTGRREILKFLLVGGDADHPIWRRIRADVSTALPARRMRLRPRRRSAGALH